MIDKRFCLLFAVCYVEMANLNDQLSHIFLNNLVVAGNLYYNM